MRDGLLAVTSEGRRLTSRRVTLPDSGILSAELTLPASRIPHPGWSTLEVRLEDVGDEEPRDDARLFVVEVSPAPAIVMLAVPPATAATGVASGRDTSGEVALSARLARRGAPRPIVRLGVRDGVRQATLSATGLYRWVFRGGAGAEAYRALVAALADWLLGGG